MVMWEGGGKEKKEKERKKTKRTESRESLLGFVHVRSTREGHDLLEGLSC